MNMHKNDRPGIRAPHDLARRDLLKRLAVVGAGLACPSAALLAAQDAASGATRVTRGRIDVHHHMTPPFYLKEMEKELVATGFVNRPWTPQTSLEAMDKSGVEVALLSPIQRLVLDSMARSSEWRYPLPEYCLRAPEP